MMRSLLLGLFCFPYFVLAQQRLHVNAFGGFANYSGDLQTKRLTLDQSNGVFGAGIKYDLTNHISVRGGINLASVQGTDKKNDGLLRERNLSFKTRLFEANLMVEYTFMDLQQKKFSPHVFGGVAVYRFNPYTYDTLGNRIYLQPLSTEGQGLSAYPGRKPYSLTQFAIPFGAGIKYRVSDNVVLSYEIGLRKLFTDYLDDLSMTYVDPVLLQQERGSQAVAMSYRGGELKDGNPVYPGDGVTRGGSKYKDWYYFTGIGITVGINGGGRRFSGRSGWGKTDCPTNL
jgi:Outer membrane protein beta-barrel domain